MFHESLSIHVFMLLFRFSSDFTWKCKTAIQIGMPFDDMSDNFLLFIVQKPTIASIPKKFAFNFLTTKQGMQQTKTVAL